MADIDHLSYTALREYACPYRFQRRRLHSAKEPAGRPADVGSEGHHLIAEILADDWPMAEHSPTLPSPAGGGSGRGRVELPPTPDVMDEAEDLVARWQDTFDLQGMTPIGIEVRAEALLDDLTPFVGYLDLALDWQGTLVIYDWKFSYHMPSSLGNDPQLASYAWLGVQKWPDYDGTTVLLRQCYPRFGGRYIEAQISPVGIRNAAYTLSRFAERLKAADASVDWPAKPCSQCGFCRLTCPLAQELVRPPQDAQAAQKLAGQAHCLSNQYGVAREALAEWCNEHGPVTAAGRTWDYVQNEQTYCPLSPRELYERYGEDALDMLEVSRKVAKKPPEGLELETRMGRATFKDKKAS